MCNTDGNHTNSPWPVWGDWSQWFRPCRVRDTRRLCVCRQTSVDYRWRRRWPVVPTWTWDRKRCGPLRACLTAEWHLVFPAADSRSLSSSTRTVLPYLRTNTLPCRLDLSRSRRPLSDQCESNLLPLQYNKHDIKKKNRNFNSNSHWMIYKYG